MGTSILEWGRQARLRKALGSLGKGVGEGGAHSSLWGMVGRRKGPVFVSLLCTGGTAMRKGHIHHRCLHTSPGLLPSQGREHKVALAHGLPEGQTQGRARGVQGWGKLLGLRVWVPRTRGNRVAAPWGKLGRGRPGGRETLCCTAHKPLRLIGGQSAGQHGAHGAQRR